MPGLADIEKLTSIFEEMGYHPCFNVPIVVPSLNVRVYYNNKVTTMSASHESSDLIINRPQGVLEFDDERETVEIKDTSPFRVMNLILKNYPDIPSKRQIAEETCGILRASKNRNESIRGYYKDLRKIIGSDILPLKTRRFHSSVKIIEILQ
ncbi:hypothetical protein E3V36_04515 [Candidatus Marinimicrobia bacterium MT.SAG.2]|nr:hypothetical protein E3V36_04515 [Candidatus Marinimicrobia bacterium MT.SAG.2]